MFKCKHHGKDITKRAFMKGVSGVQEENFFKGMVWATLLSIPLWLSFFGWIKMTINLMKYL